MRWVGAILNAMNEIQRNLSKLTTPYLLVHGDEDQLVKIDGSQYLPENSPSNDKTFKVHEWAALLTALSELMASLWIFQTNS